ncbi:MAG: amidohydrolase family protein [Pirellulales bacterium]|nr:amidohydrolase family protein [Pirellulales bacterium]
MTDTLIKNIRALEPGKGVLGDWLRIQQGRIAQIGTLGQTPPESAQVIDGGGRLLTPGLIDVHTHGVERFAYEAGPDQIVAAAQELGKYGTTCVLPTLYCLASPARLKVLEKLTGALALADQVCIPGFHLEGPFLALAGAGAETVSGDLGLLAELLAAAAGRVAAMSVSPEVSRILPIIERLCERGIVPFLTHTRAAVEQTQAAIDAGARHATHFYDVFPVPEETEPGVRPAGALEAILADPRCTVDFIADGVHVHPTAIKAALAAKGWRGVVLATDSNVGAGLPPGTYSTPVGGTVRIAAGDAARIHHPGSPLHGALAGSALTMDRGIGNLSAWLDLPESQVWAMGTSNPARLLGLNGKGTLYPGADADLVLWELNAGQPRAWRTWVGGRCTYEMQGTAP